jgi:hypothetical protein
MRSNWGESYAELKQTSSGPSKSEFMDLKLKVHDLTERVNSLMLMNQRLLDIINNPEWEEVKEEIEKDNQ